MSGNDWIKGYFLTGIGINYEIKNLRMTLGIKNLFNQTYYTYQNAKEDQYLVGNGRTYYMDLNMLFKNVYIFISLILIYILFSFLYFDFQDIDLIFF